MEVALDVLITATDGTLFSFHQYSLPTNTFTVQRPINIVFIVLVYVTRAVCVSSTIDILR